jgi:hypothetical protein
LFGTTRTVHPGVFGSLPSGRNAKTSGGVLPSFPSEKGENASRISSRDTKKSDGFLALPDGIMTHRSWNGSNLS